MPGNVVGLNGSKRLEWYIGDSRMPELLCYLSRIGRPRTLEAEQLQVEVRKRIQEATDHLGVGKWLAKPDEDPSTDVTITDGNEGSGEQTWECPECGETFVEMFGPDGYQAHFAKAHMKLQEGIKDPKEMFSEGVWEGLSEHDRQEIREHHEQMVKEWTESVLENGCVKCSGQMKPFGKTHKCVDCGWVLDYVQLSPVVSQEIPVLCSRCDNPMLKLPGGYHCLECSGTPEIGTTTEDGYPRLHPDSIFVRCRTCGSKMKFTCNRYECPRCHVTTEVPTQNDILKCSYPGCNQWFDRFNTKDAQQEHERTHLEHDSRGPI